LTLTKPRTAPPANLAAPEIRRFQWAISSYYLPEGYQVNTERRQSPWYLLVRCLLVDLPEQLEDGLGTSWRDHRVQDTGETRLLTRRSYCSDFPPLRWGRRIVFSEQTSDGESRWLTGDWLFVAYLWSDNRAWLRCVDVGNLVSFDSAVW
jgi:hypothetical protein